MSAVRAVFDTTELFEAILVRLDTKTLLLSQRVERRWQQVIGSSKVLQKKLFFLPTATFDDILDYGFLDPSDAERYNILDATSNRCKWLQQVVILNDIFFDTTREWKLRPVTFADPAVERSTVTPSWKRMLLTQPPPSTGRGDVMFWFEDAQENDELCEGMDTMGAMMDKIYSKEATVEGFTVQWDTAAVRPVKHAVDGTYYMRLLHQRQKEREALEAANAAAEEEELFEVTIFDAKGEVEELAGSHLPLASSSSLVLGEQSQNALQFRRTTHHDNDDHGTISEVDQFTSDDDFDEENRAYKQEEQKHGSRSDQEVKTTSSWLRLV